ncbi:hypothetical protein [Bacillus pseudomycoides]|uniref:hypothetical protein n=1 Tax=Bacillus pseudomycoides TaxID=64104 RepID=UPI003CF3F4E8
MDLKAKSTVGVVGYSSHVNGKLVFRVNGSYEYNDIIQRYWDREKAYIHEDCPVLEHEDLIGFLCPSPEKGE